MFSADDCERSGDNDGPSVSLVEATALRGQSAPPILFISGWASTDQIWDALRAELPDVHHWVLSWIEVLEDALAVERALASQPRPWLLVGWSLGGTLALQAALAHPNRLAGLVLVSTTARMTKDGDYPGVAPRVLRAMRMRLGRDTQRLLFDFAGLCAAPDGGEMIRAGYLGQMQRFSTAELAAGLKALATLDLRAQATSLAVPALVIHGELDGVIAVENARALAALVPGSRLEVFPRRGHALPMTVPGELATLIRGFVS